MARLNDSQLLAAENVRAAQQNVDQESVRLTQVEVAEAEYQKLRAYPAWWIEGFSIRGLRGSRLASTLEKMNVPLASYCNKLFDGQIQVRLLPTKVAKTGNAKSAVTVEVSGPPGCYELASGGQDRIIDLALHFTLRRHAKDSTKGWSSNFLIGDEIFDHLDYQAAGRALALLRDEAARVFLITHSPALRALCDSTWHVRYEDEQTIL